jgi:hypothetical protein
MLPNSKEYTHVMGDFLYDKYGPRMFSVNELSCINLMLKANIDFWTHCCENNEHLSLRLMGFVTRACSMDSPHDTIFHNTCQ